MIKILGVILMLYQILLLKIKVSQELLLNFSADFWTFLWSIHFRTICTLVGRGSTLKVEVCCIKLSIWVSSEFEILESNHTEAPLSLGKLLRPCFCVYSNMSQCLCSILPFYYLSGHCIWVSSFHLRIQI